MQPADNVLTEERPIPATGISRPDTHQLALYDASCDIENGIAGMDLVIEVLDDLDRWTDPVHRAKHLARVMRALRGGFEAALQRMIDAEAVTA